MGRRIALITTLVKLPIGECRQLLQLIQRLNITRRDLLPINI